MNTDLYLIDTNVLTRLTAEERCCAFVFKQCRIPSEVLHEAQGLPDIKALKELEYKTTAGMLQNLGEVMGTIQATDSKLVDLYHNRGNADPILVAAALHATRNLEPTLFPDRWLIVTDDRALRRKAAEFQIGTLSLAGFRALLESSGL